MGPVQININWLIGLISAFFEIIILFNLTNRLLNIRKPHQKQIFLYLAIREIFILLINLFVAIPIINYIVYIISFTLLYWYITNKFTTSVYYGMEVGYLALASEEIFYYGVSLFLDLEVFESLWYTIILLIATKSLFALFLCIYIKIVDSTKLELPQTFGKLKAIQSVFCIFLIISLSYVFPINDYPKLLTEQGFVALTVSGFIHLASVYVLHKHYCSIIHLQEEIKWYQYEIQNKISSERDLLMERHDIKLNREILSSLLLKDQVKEALEFLGRSELATEEFNLFVVGIPILDDILNLRSKEAYQYGIRFQVNTKIKQELQIDPYKLAYIFGNLLDNAIAAVKKIEPYDEEKYVVFITIKSYIGTVYINVTNYFNGKIKKDKEGNFVSTKENYDGKHGHGMSIIKKIVHEHNGNFDCKVDDHVFKAQIFINNTQAGLKSSKEGQYAKLV